MESLGHEVVPFEDVVCQMWDMLKLGDRSYVTLQVGLSFVWSNLLKYDMLKPGNMLLCTALYLVFALR